MKYIIREGTVQEQGRYWSFEAGAGRSGYFWAPDDPVFYTGNVDEVRRQALAIGGRVVRLTTKAERAVREERQAVVRALREGAKGPVRVMSAWEAQLSASCEMRILELATRIERGDHRKGE